MSIKQTTKREKHLKDFRNLQLHESISINDETTAMRVIGGWIYETRIKEHNDDKPLGWAVTSCFVPFTTNEELYDAK